MKVPKRESDRCLQRLSKKINNGQIIKVKWMSDRFLELIPVLLSRVLDLIVILLENLKNFFFFFLKKDILSSYLAWIYAC